MKLPFKRVLVTGGAGFIGSHLTEALSAAGCKVVVLDNLSSGKMDNLEAVENRIRFVEGDIRDAETVRQVSADCQVIFHLAAVVSVPQTVEDPIGSAMVNDLGTLHVFEAAHENRIAGVVFASSSAVYGDGPHLPKEETMPPITLSPYAVHKMTGEHYAHVFHHLHGMKTVSLRFFNVYGPRQDPSSVYSGVISIFMSKAIAGAPPTIFGDGTQSRDFVYVKDVVKALVLAAASPKAAGQAINIGIGRSVTVEQLWQMISRLSGCQLQPDYAPPRAGDIRASMADITRAKKLMGFSPDHSFAEGLELTFRWYQSQVDH